ncbi:MAG: hypothetical protein AAB804_02805 [Patescibacteria group bacterium]
MVYHDEEEDVKKDGAISEEVLGEVLDEDADEDEALVSDALVDDERAWE